MYEYCIYIIFTLFSSSSNSTYILLPPFKSIVNSLIIIDTFIYKLYILCLWPTMIRLVLHSVYVFRAGQLE